MEERNNGTLKLRTTTGVDSSGAESLPDNGLADVRGNEKTDAASKPVTLLEEFVEEDNDEPGNDELDDLNVVVLGK